MPPKHPTGWASRNDLIIGNRVKQAVMQQVFPEADAYTVEFDIQPNPATTVPIIAEAEIRWKVNGITFKRVLTIANGTSITGVAEAVDVIVTDKSEQAAWGGSPALVPLPYTVFIAIAKGERATGQVQPTLIPLGGSVTAPANGAVAPGAFVLDVGATATIPIPLDAGATCVQVSLGSVSQLPIPDQAVTVLQLGLGGTVAFKSYDPRDQEWVPLFPGCDQIVILNGSAHQASIAVVLGIDG